MHAESKIKDWLQDQEKKRDDAISIARKVDEYNAQIAESVKKANDARNARLPRQKEIFHLIKLPVGSRRI